MVRLPHPSRYRIFGRPASATAVARLTAVIAAAMSGSSELLLPETPIGPTAPEPSRERHEAFTGRYLVSSGGLGARATALLGEASYSIGDHRANRFLEMVEQIPGLRSELAARDLGGLRAMVSPGGRVDTDLSRRFAPAIADYATAVNYQEVNWLRGAIAVYIAHKEQQPRPS